MSFAQHLLQKREVPKVSRETEWGGGVLIQLAARRLAYRRGPLGPAEGASDWAPRPTAEGLTLHRQGHGLRCVAPQPRTPWETSPLNVSFFSRFTGDRVRAPWSACSRRRAGLSSGAAGLTLAPALLQLQAQLSSVLCKCPHWAFPATSVARKGNSFSENCDWTDLTLWT